MGKTVSFRDLLLLLFAPAVLMAGAAAFAQEVGVAVRVNGTDISVFRFERFFEEYSRQQGGGGFQMMTSPAAYKKMRAQALERLIDRELLLQEARRRRLEASDEARAQALKEIESGFRSRDAYLRRLGAMGFTEQTYAAYVAEDLAIERLSEAENPPMEDAELERFYEENPALFLEPESVRARHILIPSSPRDDPAEREKARARATELLEKARAGSDFAALAHEHSGDASAAEGGDLGWFSREEMVAPFAKAAFELEPGGTSGVVETEFGFHVIRAEERRAGRKTPLAEIRDRLRAYLEGQKREEAHRKLLERLRSGAAIERMPAGRF